MARSDAATAPMPSHETTAETLETTRVSRGPQRRAEQPAHRHVLAVTKDMHDFQLAAASFKRVAALQTAQ